MEPELLRSSRPRGEGKGSAENNPVVGPVDGHLVSREGRHRGIGCDQRLVRPEIASVGRDIGVIRRGQRSAERHWCTGRHVGHGGTGDRQHVAFT